MRLTLAYLFVALLWSTTPLAIKWSGEGPGWLFGAAARMSIGLACVLPILPLMSQSMAWHRRARLTYLASAMQFYAAMLAVYWAAQLIPSGWVSVIFGLTPLITAVLAAVWLGERSLGVTKVLSYVLGIAGLGVMFGSALEVDPAALWGMAGVLLSSLLQSASAVWVKRIDANIPALHTVAGGLLLGVPAYLATWALADGRWPASLPPVSMAAIAYLGIIATPLGFAAYFHVLRYLPATRVMLITLIAPVLSLLLGHVANGEPLTARVMAGTATILAALLLHQAPYPRQSCKRSSNKDAPASG